MLRNILAVIAGYAVMAILVPLCLSGAYIAMGSERAFEPGTFQITTLWLITMFVFGFLAAIFGGIACAKVSKHSKRAVQSLMLLVMILGMSMAIGNMNAPEVESPVVREPGTPLMDAVTKAKEPVWVSFTHPIIGCVGIMIGAMVVCPCLKKDGCEVEAGQSTVE